MPEFNEDTFFQMLDKYIANAETNLPVNQPQKVPKVKSLLDALVGTPEIPSANELGELPALPKLPKPKKNIAPFYGVKEL